MAKAQTSKKRGGLRKHGRDKEKCAAYKTMKTREKNKLKRVLQSNGANAAGEYAEKYNLTDYLRKIK